MPPVSLEQLWAETDFTPNPQQKEAIEHTDGPLFLTAGPGSGKTRVLLWRTLNLIVYRDVKPEEIFLSTFTEKAAFQLKQGLQGLLGRVTNKTNVPYDISKMYIGTVHSLCQKLIADRRFTPNRSRANRPALMDELDQYFFFRTDKTLQLLMSAAQVETVEEINAFFNVKTQSQHAAASNLISLFNRFSEENLNPDIIKEKTDNEDLRALIEMYAFYKTKLAIENQVDFSLLQQRALEMLLQKADAEHVFKHIIIDEYQDTNTIQERLFFKLAGGTQNFCVVGDDDQALYRFRAARVENFVEFPDRCRQYFQRKPKEIPLNVNYRSRNAIVSFYKEFIDQCDWRREDRDGFYRVATKNITAHNGDVAPSVVATSNDASAIGRAEIVNLVRQLLDSGKVQDPSQIAFLFPSLQYQGQMNSAVREMKASLEAAGFKVYAPRAGRFLEVEEARAVLGVFLQIFGKPNQGTIHGQSLDNFYNWIDECSAEGSSLLRQDRQLAKFVADKQREIKAGVNDYLVLKEIAESQGWELEAPYDPARMRNTFNSSSKLSEKAKGTFRNRYFERLVEDRMKQGHPFSLKYVINTATSLDWNVLDLFYRILGFDFFKKWFDVAENGTDEGPICNLALLSQHLARFLEKYTSILTASYLEKGAFEGQFFKQYLYALHQRGESEYEDADDPFPKGRIPFLTVHQSKGLEFPVVVLGSVNKRDREQPLERVIRPLLDRAGEPLERSPEFDTMRMFYVALSRAKNLLVISHPRGRGISTYRAFKPLLNGSIPRLSSFDVATVPDYHEEKRDIPRAYSYTADYLLYQKCPRQYMIFRKYDFVPSRSQMQFFGNLVHQTIEDLHQFLIGRKQAAKGASSNG